MIEITTHTAQPSQIQSRESDALVTATGPGVYNRGALHRVVTFTGVRCCDLVNCSGVHLIPEATVIASHHIPTDDYRAGEVRIGDNVKVDGAVYVVTARQYADPVLMPLAHGCDLACPYCSAEPGTVSTSDECQCDPETCESAEAVTRRANSNARWYFQVVRVLPDGTEWFEGRYCGWVAEGTVERAELGAKDHIAKLRADNPGVTFRMVRTRNN